MALNENIEVFVLYIISFSLRLITIYLAQKAQIALLIAKKVIIPVQYSDFTNVFLKKLAIKLPK